MADSDKDIIITPNISQTSQPEVKFVGKDNSPVYLKILDDNTLSFEGTEGQVFSISPTMSSGDIFSVNDISGIQSIAVNADGTITLNPTNSKRVEITGSVMIPASERIYFKSTDTYIGSDNDGSEDLHIGADGHIELEADNDTIIKQGGTELARFTSTGLGIGTTPSAKLHVDDSSLRATSLTYGAAASTIIQSENSELAFGLHNASPYPFWMQARTHTDGVRQLVINPLGGNVGIGALDADDAPLHIKSTGTSTTLLLESTDAGAADAPILELYRNSASPANGDDLGQILWSQEKADGSKSSVTKIYGEINTVDNSDRLMINVSSSGGSGLNDYEYIRLDGGVRDIIFNEGGQDIDVRMEGDSNSALFFLDASADSIGIGTTSPSETLHVVGPDSGPIAKFERDGQESVFISGNNGWGNIYTSDGVLSFGTGGDTGASAQMALNGNVLTIGDGDTQSGTDGAKLHVHDVDGYALIQATGTGTGWINAGLLLTQRQASGTRGLGMFMHDEQNDTEWFAGRAYNQDSFIVAHDSSATSHDNDLADIAGSNGSPLFTIKDNGNVGIGNTNPDTLFEIKEGGTGAAVMRLRNSNTSYPDDTAFGRIEFYNADSSGAGITAQIEAISDASGRGGQLAFKTDPSGTSPSTRMLIQGDGNIDISGGMQSTSTTKGWNLWHMMRFGKLDYGTAAGGGSGLTGLTFDDNEAGYGNIAIPADITIRAVQFRTSGVVLSGTTAQVWRIFANGDAGQGTLTNISLNAGNFTRQNSENANSTAHYYTVTGLNASYDAGDIMAIRRESGAVDMGDVIVDIYYSIDN